MNKRGISPLIATVLLVGFAIVLSAIVFNSNPAERAISQVEEMQTSATPIQFSAEYKGDVACEEEVILGTGEDSCYTLLIKNEENEDVGYIIRTIGEDGSVDVFGQDVFLNPRESKLVYVTFDRDKVGNPEKVSAEIIPITFDEN